ncbi:MAG TPA: protein kinase [Blastocatellia bacterium]|nr:protein kinase [Blastocatellia bacterium]
MKPERWKQVDELLEAALDCPAAERASFLDQACAGDEELRRELESLLISDRQAEAFIESPPARVAADLFTDKQTKPGRGARIAHYQILEQIGSGGMGEVYLAQDTRLGRKVALKLLPPSLTVDPKLRARFFREAQLASALDHPNVCTIHEVGQSSGHLFIAMQYVEGVNLKQLIDSRPLKLDALLSISLQAADALAAAHDRGIIHRDIKSNNIIITPRGQVKVLDFGLAKLMDGRGPGNGNVNSDLTSTLTRAGAVMGTPSYMSPEQARGEGADHRSDIFSLGVVIYEMASGDVPFKGKSHAETMNAVINEPHTHLSEFNEDLPAELSATIDRALSKEPADRYQSMGEMLQDLRQIGRAVGLVGSSDSQGAVTTYIPLRRRSVRRGLWAMTLLGLALLAGVGLWYSSLRPMPQPPRAPLQTTPLTSYVGIEFLPAFSPDGKQVAFVWNGEKGDNIDVYVKLVEAGTPHRLTTNPADDSFPAWSPDGSHIAFRRHTQESDAVYLTPSLSGPERKLADIFPRLLGPRVGGDGLAFSLDGKFLAVPDRSSSGEPFSIVLISTETGEKRKLSSPLAGSVGDNTPSFSPDGSQLAFSRMSGQGVEDIYVMRAEGGEPRRLTFDNRDIRDLDWTSDGREIVFISDREGDTGLWRVSALGGTPERLVSAVGYNIGRLSISRQGDRLVYSQQFVDTNIWRVELAGPNRKVSAPTMLISSSKSDSAPQYAPDGRRITFRSDRSGSFEIWACEADGSNPIQLTNFSGPQAGSPCWSPDGRQIAFDARPDGNPDIFVISADGGRPRRLTEDPGEDIAPSWSNDGRWIYFESNRSGSTQIWKMPAEGGEARQVTKGGGSVVHVSMDGKFLYYTKGRNVSGIWRVPVEGGEETAVLATHKAGYWIAWTVVEQGIYFLTAEKPAHPAIEFFSFKTGSVTEVAALSKPFRPWTNPEGLSVSTDGRWVLYTQEDRADMDLMLVENFR